MSGDTRPAGALGDWLRDAVGSIRDRTPVAVPCGGCTACCTASQFVLVEADEEEARAAIPAALLFPAPGTAPGAAVMGHDERGRCPMFDGAQCTIYERRPRACRIYDCRVYAATGITPDVRGQAAVAARVREWRFAVADADDEVREGAVRRAVAYLAAHPDVFGPAGPPVAPLAQAIAAIVVHDLFITGGEGERRVEATPDPAAVAVRLGTRR